MPPTSKKKSKRPAGKKKKFSILGEDSGADDQSTSLPKDEAGRLKIKKQYESLLGIRMGKLAGRVLNRERIDKNVEGVYFICVACKQICHNCLLYTSPSPRDKRQSRMPSSA